MKDIMKIIKALENSGILLKGVSKTIKNETKEQRGGFLSMLLGTLRASLLGNLLTGGKGIMRAGDGIVRAGSGSKKKTKFTITFPSFKKLGIKNFNKDELLHELLLTTRQNTKLRNAINNNPATDIKLSKAQIIKLIQSEGFLGKLLSKLAVH